MPSTKASPPETPQVAGLLKASAIHASKSELLTWVNSTLSLDLHRIEQLGQGAVFCQVLDAFFPDTIAMHKVSFIAKEDYEVIPNWKLLQAGLDGLQWQRDLDVPRLSKGSPAENLELLQWMRKQLAGRAPFPGYKPLVRRGQSLKGGSHDVPVPSSCSSPSFDVYGSRAAASPSSAGRPYQPTILGRVDVSRVTSKFKDGLAPPCLTPGTRRRLQLLPSPSITSNVSGDLTSPEGSMMLNGRHSNDFIGQGIQVDGPPMSSHSSATQTDMYMDEMTGLMTQRTSGRGVYRNGTAPHHDPHHLPSPSVVSPSSHPQDTWDVATPNSNGFQVYTNGHYQDTSSMPQAQAGRAAESAQVGSKQAQAAAAVTYASSTARANQQQQQQHTANQLADHLSLTSSFEEVEELPLHADEAAGAGVARHIVPQQDLQQQQNGSPASYMDDELMASEASAVADQVVSPASLAQPQHVHGTAQDTGASPTDVDADVGVSGQVAAGRGADGSAAVMNQQQPHTISPLSSPGSVMNEMMAAEASRLVQEFASPTAQQGTTRSPTSDMDEQMMAAEAGRLVDQLTPPGWQVQLLEPSADDWPEESTAADNEWLRGAGSGGGQDWRQLSAGGLEPLHVGQVANAAPASDAAMVLSDNPLAAMHSQDWTLDSPQVSGRGGVAMGLQADGATQAAAAAGLGVLTGVGLATAGRRLVGTGPGVRKDSTDSKGEASTLVGLGATDTSGWRINAGLDAMATPNQQDIAVAVSGPDGAAPMPFARPVRCSSSTNSVSSDGSVGGGTGLAGAMSTSILSASDGAPSTRTSAGPPSAVVVTSAVPRQSPAPVDVPLQSGAGGEDTPGSRPQLTSRSITQLSMGTLGATYGVSPPHGRSGDGTRSGQLDDDGQGLVGLGRQGSQPYSSTSGMSASVSRSQYSSGYVGVGGDGRGPRVSGSLDAHLASASTSSGGMEVERGVVTLGGMQPRVSGTLNGNLESASTSSGGMEVERGVVTLGGMQPRVSGTLNAQLGSASTSSGGGHVERGVVVVDGMQPRVSGTLNAYLESASCSSIGEELESPDERRGWAPMQRDESQGMYEEEEEGRGGYMVGGGSESDLTDPNEDLSDVDDDGGGGGVRVYGEVDSGRVSGTGQGMGNDSWNMYTADETLGVQQGGELPEEIKRVTQEGKVVGVVEEELVSVDGEGSQRGSGSGSEEVEDEMRLIQGGRGASQSGGEEVEDEEGDKVVGGLRSVSESEDESGRQSDGDVALTEDEGAVSGDRDVGLDERNSVPSVEVRSNGQWGTPSQCESSDGGAGMHAGLQVPGLLQADRSVVSEVPSDSQEGDLASPQQQRSDGSSMGSDVMQQGDGGDGSQPASESKGGSSEGEFVHEAALSGRLTSSVGSGRLGQYSREGEVGLQAGVAGQDSEGWSPSGYEHESHDSARGYAEELGGQGSDQELHNAADVADMDDDEAEEDGIPIAHPAAARTAVCTGLSTTSSTSTTYTEDAPPDNTNTSMVPTVLAAATATTAATVSALLSSTADPSQSDSQSDSLASPTPTVSNPATHASQPISQLASVATGMQLSNGPQGVAAGMQDDMLHDTVTATISPRSSHTAHTTTSKAPLTNTTTPITSTQPEDTDNILTTTSTSPIPAVEAVLPRGMTDTQQHASPAGQQHHEATATFGAASLALDILPTHTLLPDIQTMPISQIPNTPIQHLDALVSTPQPQLQSSALVPGDTLNQCPPPPPPPVQQHPVEANDPTTDLHTHDSTLTPSLTQTHTSSIPNLPTTSTTPLLSPPLTSDNTHPVNHTHTQSLAPPLLPSPQQQQQQPNIRTSDTGRLPDRSTPSRIPLPPGRTTTTSQSSTSTTPPPSTTTPAASLLPVTPRVFREVSTSTSGVAPTRTMADASTQGDEALNLHVYITQPPTTQSTPTTRPVMADASTQDDAPAPVHHDNTYHGVSPHPAQTAEVQAGTSMHDAATDATSTTTTAEVGVGHVPTPPTYGPVSAVQRGLLPPDAAALMAASGTSMGAGNINTWQAMANALEVAQQSLLVVSRSTNALNSALVPRSPLPSRGSTRSTAGATGCSTPGGGMQPASPLAGQPRSRAQQRYRSRPRSTLGARASGRETSGGGGVTQSEGGALVQPVRRPSTSGGGASPGGLELHGQGKLRSVQDGVATLLRHTSQLLRDVHMQCRRTVGRSTSAGGHLKSPLGQSSTHSMAEVYDERAEHLQTQVQVQYEEAHTLAIKLQALTPRVTSHSDTHPGGGGNGGVDELERLMNEMASTDEEIALWNALGATDRVGGCEDGEGETTGLLAMSARSSQSGTWEGMVGPEQGDVWPEGEGGEEEVVAAQLFAASSQEAGGVDAALKAVGVAQFNLAHGVYREALDQRWNEWLQQPATPLISQGVGIPQEHFASGTTPSHPISTGGAVQDTPPTTALATPSHGRGRAFKLGEYQLKQLRNGDVYKGRRVGSRKEGDGVYLFKNGDVYEGEFRADRMDGHGVYTFSHEGRYEGCWRGAVYNGAGSETFARGSIYSGEYESGLRCGWGVCRFYNGDYFEGQWLGGLRHGQGMQQCTDDSNYVGEYCRGKRHGQGVYTFPNGDKYSGQYCDDLPHGYGVYVFAAGQRYEGQWQAGRKHGWSTYSVEDGSQYSAHWHEGKPTWVQPVAALARAAASAVQAAGQGSSSSVLLPVPGQDLLPVEDMSPADQMRMSRAARRAALKAASQAEQRAVGHWDIQGIVQPRLRSALAAAQEAATRAQAARARAQELAQRLDVAVALATQGVDAGGGAAAAGAGAALTSAPVTTPV